MKKELRKPKQLRVEKSKVKELSEQELKTAAGGVAVTSGGGHIDMQAN